MTFSGKRTVCALLASGTLACGCIFGQSPIATPQPTSRVVLPVDESKIVTLHGNTRPEAKPLFDKGRVDPQLAMDRMLLVLQRSPEQEAALEGLLQRQLDPGSPDFHHWLSPEDFGALYGPSDLDIQIVTSWLQSHGFSVEGVSKGRTFLQFSGTAALVQQAFHTEIHRYLVHGEEHIANSSDP
ncbi:MAG TPA: protease pro-enzyme activation domain-containing protein, partial [Acidobacteriaceae bacterium]|nr:protease pro-enzyme activation domain-containing protein [Acidobacteriaceae bacterium]